MMETGRGPDEAGHTSFGVHKQSDVGDFLAV